MAQVSQARKAAFNILLSMEAGKGHADELLRGGRVSALAAQDRNLTTALVLGVLRWQLQLDAQLQAYLKKPNAKLDAEVRVALRLGAFQILHMDRIPARAAIDESVELTKQAGHKFASGMVNAVLRKLAGSAKQEVGGAAEVAAYPAWMVERWTRQFGEETTCVICRAGQHVAPMTVRLVDAGAEAELVRAGVQLEPGELLRSARMVLSGDVAGTEAYKQGRVRMQDEGSQLIAEIAGQGSAILDCCAAPGGKTMILAERNPTAGIVACEASAARLAAMRERLKDLARVEFRHTDVTALEDAARFDVVLADVPCSGTGTLGRNPEIRHRVSGEEFARQAERQRAILARAIGAAKVGGRVVYSTCSLEPEEDEQVVAAVLAEGVGARVLPLAHRVDEMDREGILAQGAGEKLKRCITVEGYLRLVPGQFGTDGFFVAMLERIA